MNSKPEKLKQKTVTFLLIKTQSPNIVKLFVFLTLFIVSHKSYYYCMKYAAKYTMYQFLHYISTIVT